jgi:hypothetical protein
VVERGRCYQDQAWCDLTHFISEGGVWSIIMLKELVNDCWSHVPCQGI